MRLRGFVDTCLWYPPTLRAVLLAAHVVGAIELVTSDVVLEELFSKLTEKAGLEDDAAEAHVATIEQLLTEGGIGAVIREADFSEIVFDGPDPDDAHVVAGAVLAEADFILTSNLKHFPADALAPFDLDAIPPDPLLATVVRELHHPTARRMVQMAVGMPPQDVRSPADLALRLEGCGLPEVAGILMSASWQRG